MSGFVGAMLPGGAGLEKYATDKFKKSGIGKISDEGVGGYLEDKWNKSGLGEVSGNAQDYFNTPPPAQTLADYQKAGGLMTNSMQLPTSNPVLPNLTQQGSIDALMSSPTWQQIISKLQQ